MKTCLAVGLAVSMPFLMQTEVASAAGGAIAMATGGEGGVYYPAGRAVCRILEKANPKVGRNCVAMASRGSIANLLELRAGKKNMAIVQSDWHYHSLKGSSKFKRVGADKNLRSVFSLHSEMFTIVARADAGIGRLEDLVGKRVNIGNIGSGARATMQVVMRAMGWKKSSFSAVGDLEVRTQAKALCANRIDVMVFTVGHPSDFVRQATRKCQSKLVSVNGPRIAKLVQNFPYYSTAWIPAGLYKGTIQKIKTFGVNATLVARADVPEATVHAVVRAVFENLGEFKSQHSALRYLERREMARNGLTAPLHPGALRYFKAAKLR